MNKFDLAARIKTFIDRTSNVYKIVKTFDYWDSEKKRLYIDESFFNIVNYCYEHVPYYRRLFDEFSLNPKHFTSIDLINKIPVLTKDIVRENYDKLCSDELSKLKYQDRRSGGTTGEPIRSLVSKDAAAFEIYSYFKGLSWMGWKPGMTTVRLFGGSLGIGKKANFRQRVYQFVTDSIFIPAFELNNKNILAYYKILKNESKICIIGYASAVNIMVGLLKSNSLSLYNVVLVITTSEQMIEDWKSNIESYFNCPTRAYYGCGEIGSLGYQMFEENENYRIPIEHVQIESDRITNELYITQLHNKAQPFIRYANGDLGTISDSCPWIIEHFLGRTADLFIRKDGTMVSPNFGAHAILHSRIPVLQYQYIQYSDKIIEFRYVMEHSRLTSENKTILQNIIEYVMGEKTEVVFNESNKFETSKSNKHRITVRVEKGFAK